jgi:dephospho-CoA kinase
MLLNIAAAKKGYRMSAWPGKFIIGLTGNIATGKSVVRKMLEHLGAYGIDADALAHRATAKGAPGYKPVVDTFGSWILAPDGQIDRAKLGRIVFSDPEALAQLEAIVHPLVEQAVDILIRRAKQPVIVIEAIKLMESGLRGRTDSLWVTYAPQEVQIARLTSKRSMTTGAALQRIKAQPPQELKTAAAHVVIQNTGSFEDTWRQVAAAWQEIFPTTDSEEEESAAVHGEVRVQRARPKAAAEIAELITRLSEGRRKLTRSDVMAAFGEKAFLLLTLEGKPYGVVGWKVENLVARTDDVYLDRSLDAAKSLKALMDEVEHTSRELQCEASLLFLPAQLARMDGLIQSLGYQARTIHSLGVRAWQEAAVETKVPDTVMLFKQLRQDRVLRPV